MAAPKRSGDVSRGAGAVAQVGHGFDELDLGLCETVDSHPKKPCIECCECLAVGLLNVLYRDQRALKFVPGCIGPLLDEERIAVRSLGNQFECLCIYLGAFVDNGFFDRQGCVFRSKWPHAWIEEQSFSV